MTEHARSAFTVDSRDMTPAEWTNGQMSHGRMKKTFTGDLVGTSVVEGIFLGMNEDGPRVYVGIERFEGTVHGKTGSFMLTHAATILGSSQKSAWTIVPGSGTGALAGLRGECQITPKHEFTVDYELG